MFSGGLQSLQAYPLLKAKPTAPNRATELRGSRYLVYERHDPWWGNR